MEDYRAMIKRGVPLKQVRALMDANTPAAKEAAKKENQIKMDILMKAYNQARAAAANPVITGSMPTTGLGKGIYEEFYALSDNFTVSSKALGPNDFLLNAASADELLKIAGYKKTNRKGVMGRTYTGYEPGYYEAATSLFDAAKQASILGGSAFLTEQAKPTEYDIAKMLPKISEELQTKYNTLGSLQRGELKNETETTADDEQVMFFQDPALAMEAELKKIQKDFSQLTKNINEEFTRYGQSTKKIGTYQTASLSEEQMFKKILQGIRETYTRFNGEAENAYVGNRYANTTPANFQFSSATPDAKAYLQTLPTLIKP